MKKSLLSIASIVALGFTSSAFGASIGGDAQVILTKSISMEQSQSLNFGVIEHDGSAQSVSISPSGTVACGSYTCTAGTSQEGIFKITGSDGSTINLTKTDGVLSDGDGHTINIVPSFTAPTITGSVSGTNVSVGASLGTIAASQVAGIYSTSNVGGSPYVITANY